MNSIEPQFSKTFFLAAGQCNAEGLLPLQWLVQRLIDVATLHANSINIGYARLIKHNASWVLHSVVIEMNTYPKVNQEFTVDTWIAGTGPVTSDRAFRILDASGDVIGYALTTWVAIDIEKRRAMRLNKIFDDGLPDTGVYPPLESFRQIPRLSECDLSFEYGICYTDLDCNRHVTTRRYVELMLNCLPLEYFDKHYVSRFELAFHTEALFGEQIKVCYRFDSDDELRFELKCGDTLLAAAKATTSGLA